MATTNLYAGKLATFTIGAAVQPMTDWSMSVINEVTDATNFGSGGFRETVSTINACDITASGPYDGSSGVTFGAIGSAVLTITDSTSPTPVTMTFTVPIRVTNVTIAVNVRGIATINITAESTGSFSISA